MSQQVFTTNNTATILQNHTEQTLVEVSAINNCGLMSDSALTIINTTGSQATSSQYCDSFCTDPNTPLTTTSTPSEDETGTVLASL
jgi:hypothetical protein